MRPFKQYYRTGWCGKKFDDCGETIINLSHKVEIMLRILLISFSLILCITSCDYLNESPEKLVGKVYLWSTDGSNRKILNLKTGENSYSPLGINGTVSIALASDSLIYVKSEFQESPIYHLIKHESGEKVINIETINSISFIKFEQSKNFKYSYHSK
jgi:hypothetical protein